MNNELITLTLIIGIMVPTYFIFATKFSSNKKASLSIHILAVITFLILGKAYRYGILKMVTNPFLVFGLMALIGTPSLLVFIYLKKKMLIQSLKHRKKYYLYPTLGILGIIFIIALISNLII